MTREGRARQREQHEQRPLREELAENGGDRREPGWPGQRQGRGPQEPRLGRGPRGRGGQAPGVPMRRWQVCPGPRGSDAQPGEQAASRAQSCPLAAEPLPSAPGCGRELPATSSGRASASFLSSRSTFKEFAEKYGRDQRFRLVQKRKDQEHFFNQFILILKKRDKENRLRLRKMR